MYYYKSKIGILWIKPHPGHAGRWWLGYDDEALGSYASANSAAGDVYTHTTGLWEWDKLDGKLFDVPDDIREWEEGEVE